MSSSTPTQRPVVFMDVMIGETPAGRMKMELFSDIVPKCVFRIAYMSIDDQELLSGRPKTSVNCARVNTGVPQLVLKSLYNVC